MEQTANTFTGGLIKDLNPIATPNDVLTDALNATLITFNGNETMLQNDMGNTNLTYYPRIWEAIESEDNTATDYREVVSKIREKVKLKDGYIPIGIKEHGDIIYIVSYNPEENRTEIGSFPGPEYRPLDKTPSKEINKDVIIKEDTLSKIYNLTEEGETLLKPYDLISDYSMEGLSPMFISTPTNKGLYIPKYINVNTNQDITDTINIKYTYKTKHQWSNGDELTIYNYNLSLETFDRLNKELSQPLTDPYIYSYDREVILPEQTLTETITEEYYPQVVTYTYQEKDRVLLQTHYDLFNSTNKVIVENITESDYLCEKLDNQSDINPFISYPNIKKGDIGVSYTIEDIEGIMYTNEKTEEFSYKTYIPEVSYANDLVYENVIINTGDENSIILNYKFINQSYPVSKSDSLFISMSNKYYTNSYGEKEIVADKYLRILHNDTFTFKTQGYYLGSTYMHYKFSELKYFDLYNYKSNDIIYITQEEYNTIEKIKCSDGSTDSEGNFIENYEIIEKIITLNINGINVQVPALLYRKIS